MDRLKYWGFTAWTPFVTCNTFVSSLPCTLQGLFNLAMPIHLPYVIMTPKGRALYLVVSPQHLETWLFYFETCDEHSFPVVGEISLGDIPVRKKLKLPSCILSRMNQKEYDTRKIRIRKQSASPVNKTHNSIKTFRNEYNRFTATSLFLFSLLGPWGIHPYKEWHKKVDLRLQDAISTLVASLNIYIYHWYISSICEHHDESYPRDQTYWDRTIHDWPDLDGSTANDW